METQSGRLKLAFVGGAFDSAVGRAHKSAIDLDQRYELVAGCFSRDREKNTLSGHEYNLEPRRVYGDIQTLLDQESRSIDAVVILTPQQIHGQQINACIDANIPIICEKALVSSVAEANEIEQRLFDTSGFLAVTYNYTGYPIVRELRNLIKQKKLGKIQQIQIEMPQEGYARLNKDGQPVTPQEWRLNDQLIPTISLDLGVHLHILVKFLTNQSPLQLIATSKSYGHFKQITDSISCIAEYSNDITCSIWYSKSALGYRNGMRIRVFGETGAAEWLQSEPECLTLADQDGRTMRIDRGSNGMEIACQGRYTRFKAGHPAGFIEAFANYYNDISDSLRHYIATGMRLDSEYVFGIQESVEGLRMLEAITESSISRKWISVSQ